MVSARVKYFAAGVTAAIIWGFFAIPLRNLKAYPSEEILYFRTLVSLLITSATLYFFRKKNVEADIQTIRSISPKEQKKLLLLTLSAGILITANWYSFIYAINHVSLKSAAFAYMVCPLITALGGFFLLSEKATAYKIAGISIAIVSILILASGSLIDVLWSVGIAALYAFYLIIQRFILQTDKLLMLAAHLLIAAVIITPFFISYNFSIPTDINFWLNILLISLVFTVLPLFLSLYALIGLESSTMGILIYINPIIAFTVAFVLFNEPVNSLQAFAYLLLFIAVIIFNWSFIKTALKIN